LGHGPNLTSATNFVGANAAGANPNGFMGPVFGDDVAPLQVGLLEKPVVLVGEANLVGFIAAFVANFAGGHDEILYQFLLRSTRY